MLAASLELPSDISDLILEFRGSEHSPFLAPRGIWIHGEKLCVSDTGQNRVFIWNKMPTSTYQSPDVVLGQAGEVETGRNGNDQVTGGTLQYPSGIWSDGEKLIVADAWNHRVLVWHTFPSTNGQVADAVIGQADFNSNQPNIKGLQSPASSQSLYWPYGVHSDGKQLWIADTGNRRVLHYDRIPEDNLASADHVIGKPDFASRDYEPREPIWPYSVRVNAKGQLAITDTQYFRVLLWEDWRDACAHAEPTEIIGQQDLEACGLNQYGLTPSQKSLNWCYDSFFYQDGLMVLDTANSRVKWHSRLLKENNPPADGLLGQPDFCTSSENIANIKGTEFGLYWPFSLCIDGLILALADTGNHRIILNQLSI